MKVGVKLGVWVDEFVGVWLQVELIVVVGVWVGVWVVVWVGVPVKRTVLVDVGTFVGVPRLGEVGGVERGQPQGPRSIALPKRRTKPDLPLFMIAPFWAEIGIANVLYTGPGNKV